MQVKPDFDTVQKSLRWSCPSPDKIIEVRTLAAYRGYASVGYFNDPVLAANTICNGDSDGIAGTYVTLNPVTPEAFARCSNRMVSGRDAVFTHDKEILERRGLLLDFDPVRISGISSSDEEHRAALDRMLAVTTALTQFYGWPTPCLIDSGNGGHARYMLERLANDPENTELVKNTLRALDARFSNDRVTIDKSVFNAARIVRVPGTVARKGENTPERPHRVSRILQDYDPLDVLRRRSLERVVNAFAPLLPNKPKGAVARLAEYPADEAMYRRLNTTSRERFAEWVPHLLGDLARPSGEGYRISSRDLGRDLEEDIFIGPMGIKDFGVADMGDATEGRRTSITLLAEILFNGDKRRAAAQLSMTLNTPMNEFEGKALQDPVADDPVTMPASLMGSPTEYRGMVNARSIDPLASRRLTWMIEDFVLKKHYNLLTAPPKMGKSTLSRMLVASLLTGLPFLGRRVEGGPVGVLYIAYEDLEGDLVPEVERNIKMLLKEAGIDPGSPDGFAMLVAAKGRFYCIAEQEGETDFFNRVPRGLNGQHYLRQDLAANTHIKVMFVDPIRFLRDETTRSRNIVDQEYYEGLDFKQFAQETNVAVFGIHHNNKDSGKKASEGNDPLTAIGGTSAVAGAAGNIITFRGDRIPRGIEGHVGIYCSSRINSSVTIMVTPRYGRFYLSPPDSEIFRLRNLEPISGGRPGRPTDGPSGREVDSMVEKYLKEKKVGTISGISEAINVARQTVNNRMNLMVQMEILERFEDETGLFKATGPGARPMLYRLKNRVRMPD